MKSKDAVNFGLASISVLVLPTIALMACDGGKHKQGQQGNAVLPVTPAGVSQACGRCHNLPPADSLPTREWPEVIDQMVGLAAASSTPLHPDDIIGAQTHYRDHSPAELTVTGDSERTSWDTHLWKVSHFTPPGLEQTLLPAVAHVAVEQMAEGEPLSLLAPDMRSRVLLHLPVEPGTGETPILYPMLRELNYPARVVKTDFNGDGLSDFVIAGIGSMQPNNDADGTIFIVQQQSGRRFQRQSVADGLGRPADVCAVDFDEDGDIDIAFSAFGLRDPGQLALLENRTISAQGKIEMELRQLDSRDGFTSLSAVDMDGDGALDIVALLAQEHEQVVVYRNEGNLRFSQSLVWAAPHPSWAFSHLQISDINGDGLPDIVTINGDSLDYNVLKPYSGVQGFLNQGGLQFRLTTIGSLPGGASSASADMDEDGDLDIVATAFMPLSTPRQWIDQKLASIVWFENPGVSTEEHPWVKHVIERHSASHPTVAVADWDGDGLSDIVVGNYVWIDRQRGPLHRSPYVSLYSRTEDP